MGRAQRISMEAFAELIGDGSLASLPKAGVLWTAEGRMVKVFRPGGGVFSSARWRGYGQRFAYAAEELSRRGVPTVRVAGVYRVGPERRDVVIYEPLAGRSLREVVGEGGRAETLLPEFARFVARLHECGACIRSMHWENVLVLPGGGFGLIDMASARFSRGVVWPGARAREFRRFFAYEADREALGSFGCGRFVRTYVAASSLRGWRKRLFVSALGRQHAMLGEAVRDGV